MPLPKIAIIRNVESQKISLPRYGNPVGTSMTLLSACADSIKIAPNHYEIIDTGLAIALPIGLEAQVRSLKESTRTAVFVLNAPVTIDAFDRKDIKVCLYNASNESVIIKYNDPIALLVFSPTLRVEWDDMTTKRQIQATQTEAFIQRSQQENVSADKPQELDEFEPIEQAAPSSDTSEEEKTEHQPVIQEAETQQTPDNNDFVPNELRPVEPPAIIKELEEKENVSSDMKENGVKNEN